MGKLAEIDFSVRHLHLTAYLSKPFEKIRIASASLLDALMLCPKLRNYLFYRLKIRSSKLMRIYDYLLKKKTKKNVVANFANHD